MRTSLIAGVVASTLTFGVSLSQGDNGSSNAKVRMLDAAPVTLRGVGFERNERVRLTVSLGERAAFRRPIASDVGAFTVAFRDIRYGRCGPSLAVKAIGSRGSRVAWEIVPLDCPDRADS